MPILDDILDAVQPVACDDLTLRAYQWDLDVDRARRRLERLVARGSDDRDIRRAINNLHRLSGE